MQAASSNKEPRPWVVDLLSTLFVAFCIGVASAIALGTCVILMAGEARGATQLDEPAPADEACAKASELVLTHQLVTKYTGLVAMDRSPGGLAETDTETAAMPGCPANETADLARATLPIKASGDSRPTSSLTFRGSSLLCCDAASAY